MESVPQNDEDNNRDAAPEDIPVGCEDAAADSEQQDEVFMKIQERAGSSAIRASRKTLAEGDLGVYQRGVELSKKAARKSKS